MKGLVYHGDETLRWEDVADVFPKAGEVKLRIKAAGICGSDIHGYQGITGRRIPPMIMGHEFAGEVAELGEGVTSLKVGDRVSCFPVDYCETCDTCKKGDFHLCPNRRQFGVLTVDGAFAEYLCVPAKTCFKLADSVSFPVGCTIEPLAVAYRAVGHAGNLEGKTVLLIGTGTIGLMALACAKLQNPKKILVSDLSDERLEVAKAMGADILINPTRDDVKQIVQAETNGLGVDVSFEACGLTPTCQQSISSLRVGGTSVWIGQGKPIVEIPMLEIVTRELTITGTFLYGYEEFRTVVGMLNKGTLDVTPLISACAPMDEAPQWFERQKTPGNLIKVVLTDINDGASNT